MIILKLKNGEEEWVDSITEETIDGIAYFNFSVKAKNGKIIKGAYQKKEIVGWKDVGEKKSIDQDEE